MKGSLRHTILDRYGGSTNEVNCYPCSLFYLLELIKISPNENFLYYRQTEKPTNFDQANCFVYLCYLLAVQIILLLLSLKLIELYTYCYSTVITLTFLILSVFIVSLWCKLILNHPSLKSLKHSQITDISGSKN